MIESRNIIIILYANTAVTQPVFEADLMGVIPKDEAADDFAKRILSRYREMPTFDMAHHEEKDLLRFFEFCWLIRKRLRDDFDLSMACTGGRGIGKSVFSIQTGTIVQYGDITNELMKKFITDKMLLAPTPDEIIQKHQEKTAGQFGVMVLDEAMRVCYSREFMSKDNIQLNKIFTVNRKENMLHILCIPSFYALDNFWRNDRVKYWAHIYGRGKVVIFAQGLNPFQKDRWNLSYNEFAFNRYIQKQHRKAYELEEFEQEGVYKYLSNYLMSFEFPDIDQKLLTYYKELTEENRYDFKRSTSQVPVEPKSRYFYGEKEVTKEEFENYGKTIC